ncbi:DNA replication protein DnaC [Kushneria sinocarnis]|uniref:DNA replication protein DnaC n=1 Tax=Kushneria sinocarnis TaxID=595502 RepID=A0A420WUJ9_9GAMM|nr:ATP-binding protein [Kushneria sinocarnis]RKQ97121.1 DNA replication protein DnaC [Kushneria sinocarnis]
MSSENILSMLGASESKMVNCEIHGQYESTHFVLSNREFWSGCPSCAEEKAERERGEQLRAEQEAYYRKRTQDMLGYACIPPRFADKTFDSYRAETDQQQRYKQKCQAYADEFVENLNQGEGMLMLGDPGTGKTHLAVAVLNEIIRSHGIGGVYTTAARMYRRIKDTYSSREETESQAIAAFTKPSLLVLDEIGVSFGSDAELNYLFDVMNERYEQCLPTIVVSNVQPEEIGKWMGDRVVDRLRECSKMMVFNWESARKGIGRGES